MALASSGITTSLVGNTLGISNRNVGGLCTSSNVNPWSKWKPIHIRGEKRNVSICGRPEND